MCLDIRISSDDKVRVLTEAEWRIYASVNEVIIENSLSPERLKLLSYELMLAYFEMDHCQ